MKCLCCFMLLIALQLKAGLLGQSKLRESTGNPGGIFAAATSHPLVPAATLVQLLALETSVKHSIPQAWVVQFSFLDFMLFVKTNFLQGGRVKPVVVLDHLVDLLDAHGIGFIPEQSNAVQPKINGMNIIHRFTHNHQNEDRCKPPIVIWDAPKNGETTALRWPSKSCRRCRKAPPTAETKPSQTDPQTDMLQVSTCDF